MGDKLDHEKIRKLLGAEPGIPVSSHAMALQLYRDRIGKDRAEYRRKLGFTAVPVADLKTMVGMKCEHELRGEKSCDDADIDRGGCCNACWARRWADRMLKLHEKKEDRLSKLKVTVLDALDGMESLLERTFIPEVDDIADDLRPLRGTDTD